MPNSQRETSFTIALASARAASGLSLTETVSRLNARGVDLSRSRLNALEIGRSVTISRADCAALTEVLNEALEGSGSPAVEPGYLWARLVEDDMKVEPDVRAYFEERVRDAVEPFTEDALSSAERGLVTHLRGHERYEGGTENLVRLVVAVANHPDQPHHRFVRLPLREQNRALAIFSAHMRAVHGAMVHALDREKPPGTQVVEHFDGPPTLEQPLSPPTTGED